MGLQCCVCVHSPLSERLSGSPAAFISLSLLDCVVRGGAPPCKVGVSPSPGSGLLRGRSHHTSTVAVSGQFFTQLLEEVKCAL